MNCSTQTVQQIWKLYNSFENCSTVLQTVQRFWKLLNSFQKLLNSFGGNCWTANSKLLNSLQNCWTVLQTVQQFCKLLNSFLAKLFNSLTVEQLLLNSFSNEQSNWLLFLCTVEQFSNCSTVFKLFNSFANCWTVLAKLFNSLTVQQLTVQQF